MLGKTDLVQTEGSLAITPGGWRSAETRKHQGNETLAALGSLSGHCLLGVLEPSEQGHLGGVIWSLGNSHPSSVLSSELRLLSIPRNWGLLFSTSRRSSCVVYTSPAQLGGTLPPFILFSVLRRLNFPFIRHQRKLGDPAACCSLW